MGAYSRSLELAEKIIVETRSRPCVALSIGGCGILVDLLYGTFDGGYKGARRMALRYAHHVLNEIAFTETHERSITPQTLVNSATVVFDNSVPILLQCTTWQAMEEGVEICSVGASSVLVFEGATVREVVSRHTVNEQLRLQGLEAVSAVGGEIALRGLGGSDPCPVDEVRVAFVPLLPETTIAIIKDRRLVKDIYQRKVSGDEPFAFIDAWNPPGKRIRTSILISL